MAMVAPTKFVHNFHILCVGERLRASRVKKSAQSSVTDKMAPSPRELSSERETEGVLELSDNSFHRRSAVPPSSKRKATLNFHHSLNQRKGGTK